MTLCTELKCLAAILFTMATMFGGAYSAYRVDRHELTTLRRNNAELRAVASDHEDLMTVAGMMSKSVRK